MDEKSKAAMIDQYSRLLEIHGSTKEALAYQTTEQQTKRYACLTNIEPIQRESSVLDVGCGLGYLCEFLRNAGWQGKYTGVDINSDMIAAAKQWLPGEDFICTDILVDDFCQQSDYVFCGATVELRPKFADPEEYLYGMIRKMFSLAKKGLAFDVFSNRVDYTNEEHLYVDPASLLEFCYDLTTRLTLRNDYRPYELIAYLYVAGPVDEFNLYSNWAVPHLYLV